MHHAISFLNSTLVVYPSMLKTGIPLGQVTLYFQISFKEKAKQIPMLETACI